MPAGWHLVLSSAGVLLSLLAAGLGGATAVPPTAIPPSPRGRIWALLAAGSSGFQNYRHQADLCHAYQVLHSNGIPDENIIVMMYDDIANSQDNPTPGIIINHPGGPNVYEGVPKDYTGDEVNAENFLNVLSGNSTAMRNIGSGKVIKSGPNDVIFINFVDHGGEGVLYFPNDELMADKLIKAISKLASARKFSKLIMYIEACHAGSMFDNLLVDNTNVFALTAADPFESSYACYFDDSRQTYLGDVFSVTWMNDSEHESLPMESIHHQFERVRTLTNTSHVEEYGDLDIGSTKLKDVIGFRMRLGASRYTSTRPPPPMDVADNMDVPLSILDKKIQIEKDPTKRREHKLEKHRLIKRREIVDEVFKDLVERVSDGSVSRRDELRLAQYSLSWHNFPCYKDLYKTFSKRCMSLIQNPYGRVHLQKLINMCSAPWLTLERSIDAVATVCSEPRGFPYIRAF